MNPAELALVAIAGISLLVTGIAWSVGVLRQRPRERLEELEREVKELRAALQELERRLQSRQ
ncbi:MAG: hypothetical protein M0T72_08445 [Candidatus Dormibacteraeota bacterium]|nr:hypothetical protein [Candidatus Dormibacteraeota bacterium]